MNKSTSPCRVVYSQAEFCEAYGISRTHLHVITEVGKGPRTFNAGRRVLITVEAAREWVRNMELESSGEK